MSTITKLCTKCSRDLPVDDFRFNRKKPLPYCRDCERSYNRNLYSKKIGLKNKSREQILRELVQNIFVAGGLTPTEEILSEFTETLLENYSCFFCKTPFKDDTDVCGVHSKVDFKFFCCRACQKQFAPIKLSVAQFKLMVKWAAVLQDENSSI